MGRFRVAAVGAAAVVAVGVGAARSAAPLPPLVLEGSTPAPLLGFGPAGGYSYALVRLDPQTLRRVGRRYVVTGDYSFAWSFSPSRARLALGSQSGQLLVVDTRRLRAVRRIDTHLAQLVQATQWVDSNNLIAVVARCCNVGPTTVVGIEASRRKVVARRQLDASVQAVAHVPQGLVVLLGPTAGLGPSRLAVVGARAAVRTVELDQIRSGREAEAPDRRIVAYESPALVTDREGRTAYVLGAAPEVVEIDLATLRVTYHALSQPVSLVGRLHDWLEAPAQAKGAPNGGTRNALWLGNGVLAVFGADDHAAPDAAGTPLLTSAPSGLQLVDTRDWTLRTLDAGADTAAIAEDALLAAGRTWRSDTQTLTGTGLTIFGADGVVRARLFGSRAVTFEAVGARAFVASEGPGPVGYDVVDVRSGEVVTTVRDRPLPVVLGALPFPY